MTHSNNIPPAVIARETLLKLGSLKLQPTPDNYHEVYDDIAGKPANQMCASATKMLGMFVNEFPRHTQELSSFANMLERAVKNKNWGEYKSVIMKLAELAAESDSQQNPLEKKTRENQIPWADTISRLLKQLEMNHGRVTIARKREGLNRILSKRTNDLPELQHKIIDLIETWNVLATDTDNPTELESENSNTNTDADNASWPEKDDDLQSEQAALVTVKPKQSQFFTDEITSQLLELLEHMIGQVATIHQKDASLNDLATTMAHKVRAIQNKKDMEQFAGEFKYLLDKLEYNTEDSAILQKGLLKLLDKILSGTGELLSEDVWVKNQLAKLKETISRPLDKRLISEAESCWEEIIQRQSVIRLSLSDARSTFKNMVTSLIGNIEELSDETSEYHDKIEGYTEQINQTDDIVILNQLLTGVMKETRQMQENTKSYRDDFLSAREEVAAAEEKIVELESELQKMSEKIHEDHLTGILNRRGLDLAYDREISRASRQQSPLCYALLDIDNFKSLNDTYGHNVGDEALVYLVTEVNNVTRNEDVVARYGGEEFVILLPNTTLKEAVGVLSRIRREMTKKFFMHENKKILVTFSAGVAEYKDGEMQETIFKRADEALYRAKKNGKNLILEAD